MTLARQYNYLPSPIGILPQVLDLGKSKKNEKNEENEKNSSSHRGDIGRMGGIKQRTQGGTMLASTWVLGIGDYDPYDGYVLRHDHQGSLGVPDKQGGGEERIRE